MQYSRSLSANSSWAEKDAYSHEKKQTEHKMQEVRSRYQPKSVLAERKPPRPDSHERRRSVDRTTHVDITPQKPLAESTPRHRSGGLTTWSKTEQTKPTSTPRRVHSMGQSKLSASSTSFELSQSTGIDVAAILAKYEKIGNVKVSSLGSGFEKASSTTAQGKVKKSYEIYRDDANNSPSKVKQIVEIKHRNSAELDLSKSFRPIEPASDNEDEEVTNTLSGSSYRSTYHSSVKPGLSKLPPSNTKYQHYRGHYESCHHGTSYTNSNLYKSSTSYSNNTSYDSAYASKSKLLSSPASTSASSSAYTRVQLPDIPSLRNKYLRGGYGDRISKVPALFSAKTIPLLTA